MNLRLRQITFQPDHRAYLLDGAVEYFNPAATKFLENEVIRDLYLTKDDEGCDFYGVLSWRFLQKTSLHRHQLEAFLTANPDAEMVSFFGTRRIKEHNVWSQAVALGWHPATFTTIAERLFAHLGIKQHPHEVPAPYVYYNYWLAEPEVFRCYCAKYLLPAMAFLANEPLADQDAKYTDFHRQAVQDPVRLTEIFGKPYYTFHPFILERLPGTFAYLEKINLKQMA